MIEYTYKDNLRIINNVKVMVEQTPPYISLYVEKERIRENGEELIPMLERYLLDSLEEGGEIEEQHNKEKVDKLNAILCQNREQFSQIKDMSKLCEKLMKLYNKILVK